MKIKVMKAQMLRSWMKCQITRRQMGWSLRDTRIPSNGKYYLPIMTANSKLNYSLLGADE